MNKSLRMQPKKQFPFITITYGIAAILVVFGHSRPLHVDYPLVGVVAFLYKFHMPLFFFIAGILIAYTTDTRKKILKWWKHKVKKLMLPYLTLSLLAYVPKVLLGNLMNDDMTVSLTNIIRIIFIPREGVWGHFWFIPTYLALSILGAFICTQLNKMKNNNKRYYICLLVMIGLALNYRPINTAWFAIKDISIEFVYIVLGIVFSRWVIFYKARKKDFITCTLCLGLSIGANYISNEWLFSFTVSLLMIIFVILLSKIIEALYDKQQLTFIYLSISAVGVNAFIVYLYSWPMQAVLEIILVVLCRVPWYVAYITMFSAGLIGPIVLLYLYKRFVPSNKIINALLGVN